MNATNDISCNTCQTGSGFTSSDRQAIILMVILAATTLVFCYVGVLWFAIRTRFKRDKNVLIRDNNIHVNDSFSERDMDEIELVRTTQNLGSSMFPFTTRQSIDLGLGRVEV